MKKNNAAAAIALIAMIICITASHAETLAGTDKGLFAVEPSGTLTELWSGGSVKKIVSLPDSGWAILSSAGIFVSMDLKKWEPRNQGLTIKTVKVFENGKKSLLKVIQEIKDFDVHPANPQIFVCATKDTIFLSKDQGKSWKSLDTLPYNRNGIKAVAAANMPRASGDGNDLTVFATHNLYGFNYIQPDIPNVKWVQMNDGIEKLETTDDPDEIADILVAPYAAIEKNSAPEIYISQTFRRRVYKMDWKQKLFKTVWSDTSSFGTVESLYHSNNNLFFIKEKMAAYINLSNFSMQKSQELSKIIEFVRAKTKLNSIAVNSSFGKFVFNELWLFNEHKSGVAANREGLYMPTNLAIDKQSFASFMKTMEKAGLNMIVIDMKDEDGNLRFTPKNSAITSRGKISSPLDIDAFLQDMKKRNIYAVARIVVFKDKVLAAKENGRFAVWDSQNKKPWQGYDGRQQKLFNENWVDPYSEEVWEYIALLSEELHQRGFDEIQFDYIRFPTDGDNLPDARFRWQDEGMDRESALLSFLRHIRKRVSAPISIDIYGFSGFHRTGGKTGQDVELITPYVDVFCPMFYPSHWNQPFFAQNPPELRPWRIYFFGTQRNAYIARGQAIIRPYAQAFYINVSYDRQYYNAAYVRSQIEAVRSVGKGGYTHWNSGGVYKDIPLK